MVSSQERFTAVFDEHFDAVLRFALARAEPETAKDATAETFLAAWRTFDRLPADPRGWLLAVCRNKLADHYRLSGRQLTMSELVAPASASAARDHGDSVVEQDRVRTAFLCLRQGDQDLLRLLAWDGLSHREAAEVLACSPALFSVRLHRARRRLRAALAEQEKPDNGPVRLPIPEPLTAAEEAR
jgi:RNA polymerase sigma-70 factor (ECF subfamily)